VSLAIEDATDGVEKMLDSPTEIGDELVEGCSEIVAVLVLIDDPSVRIVEGNPSLDVEALLKGNDELDSRLLGVSEG
jgi:hypothetical protein